MKKVLLVICLGLLMTGCFNKKEDKINQQILEEIDKIKIEEIKEFADLIKLTNITIESEIGLNKTDIESYVGKYSYPMDSKFYLVVKPKKDKIDTVKDTVELYISNLKERIIMNFEMNHSMSDEEKEIINSKIEMLDNMVKEEYNDYLIYISSNNNKEVLSIIKDKLK